MRRIKVYSKNILWVSSAEDEPSVPERHNRTLTGRANIHAA